MKLNILPPTPKVAKAPAEPESLYASPIGWWKVTTEGDCEGRSTTDLGEHYGHVAEIAFALADKAYYGLRFTAFKKSGGKRSNKPIHATGNPVAISLDIDSNTWGYSAEARAVFFNEWLKADNIVAKPYGPNGAHYYASTWLYLKEDAS